MALASTPDLASYGFGYLWAKQAYVSPPSIKTGNTTLEGDSPRTYIGQFAIKGARESIAIFPAYISGANSSIDGGSTMGGLKVVNTDVGSGYGGFLGAILSGGYSSTNWNRELPRALFNLYTLQSPSVNSNTESNALTLSGLAFPGGEVF